MLIATAVGVLFIPLFFYLIASAGDRTPPSPPVGEAT
jgi:hypothetical protein